MRIGWESGLYVGRGSADCLGIATVGGEGSGDWFESGLYVVRAVGLV